MKAARPTDRVDTITAGATLSAKDRRRLVEIRRRAGAVEVRFVVEIRPAGEGAWRRIKHATQVYRAHSALNAEQLIIGGPLAGRHFAATTELLEYYEHQHKGESPNGRK